MLISIVVMYTVCWTPSIVDEFLTSFGYICRPSNTPTLKYMRMGFHALAYCQSCINPICYAFISQNFRTTFRSAYSRMRLKGQVRFVRYGVNTLLVKVAGRVLSLQNLSIGVAWRGYKF
ncbi:unnamed protein product [Anisakis simplex]|uniref:G_PROTEIN_RECEP_F1_2 domain-containing protein n=1 Tax=Anisakis simplex TaxID=6269 RepID=A0A0M3J9G5_ANISI|nr:unnamed protein product [Anisakis simplex]